MERYAGEAIEEYGLRPHDGLPHPVEELTIDRLSRCKSPANRQNTEYDENHEGRRDKGSEISHSTTHPTNSLENNSLVQES